MTSGELARIWFECEEQERQAVNEGHGSIKDPGLPWVIWRWQDVSQAGRAFKSAVAKRVQVRLGIGFHNEV